MSNILSFTGLFISTILILASINSGASRDPQRLRPLEQVVKVTTYSGFCSGFIIGPDLIGTAAHCVVSEKGVIKKGVIIYSNDQKANFEVVAYGGVVASDDWAILKASTGMRSPFRFTLDEPDAGEMVRSIGHPNGVYEQVTVSGMLLSVGKTYRIAISNYPGDSGSAILLKDSYEVIGIVSATYTHVPVTIATPIFPLAKKFFQLGYYQ